VDEKKPWEPKHEKPLKRPNEDLDETLERNLPRPYTPQNESYRFVRRTPEKILREEYWD
jgi:hypothetical protein